MPTYTNNSGSTVAIQGIVVQSGASIATPKIIVDANFTKIAEEPYFNPVQALTKVTAAGAGDVTHAITNPMKCKRIRIQKVSASNVTVYLRAKTNLPAVLLEWASTDPPADIFVDGMVDQLILTFSGAASVQVLELGE